MKKSLFFLFMSFVTAVTAWAVLPTTAVGIEENKATVLSNVGSVDPADWRSIEVSGKGTVQIDVTCGNDFMAKYTFIQVYDANETEVARLGGDDNYDGSSVTFDVEEGKYYLKVNCASSVTLTWKFTAAPAGPTQTGSGSWTDPYSMFEGAPFVGTKFYALNVTEASDVTVEFDGTVTGAAVYDATNEYADAVGTFADGVLTVKNLAAGSYLIQAGTGSNGTFKTITIAAATVEPEPETPAVGTAENPQVLTATDNKITVAGEGWQYHYVTFTPEVAGTMHMVSANNNFYVCSDINQDYKAGYESKQQQDAPYAHYYDWTVSTDTYTWKIFAQAGAEVTFNFPTKTVTPIEKTQVELTSSEFTAEGGKLTFAEEVYVEYPLTVTVAGAKTKNIACKAQLEQDAANWNVINVTFVDGDPLEATALEAGDYVLQIPTGKIWAEADADRVVSGDFAFTVEAPVVDPTVITPENTSYTFDGDEDSWYEATVTYTAAHTGAVKMTAQGNFFVNGYEATGDKELDAPAPFYFTWNVEAGQTYTWTLKANGGTTINFALPTEDLKYTFDFYTEGMDETCDMFQAAYVGEEGELVALETVHDEPFQLAPNTRVYVSGFCDEAIHTVTYYVNGKAVADDLLDVDTKALVFDIDENTEVKVVFADAEPAPAFALQSTFPQANTKVTEAPKKVLFMFNDEVTSIEAAAFLNEGENFEPVEIPTDCVSTIDGNTVVVDLEAACLVESLLPGNVTVFVKVNGIEDAFETNFVFGAEFGVESSSFTAEGGKVVFNENVDFVDADNVKCLVVGAETKNIAGLATLSLDDEEFNVVNVTFDEPLTYAGKYVLQLSGLVMSTSEEQFYGNVEFTVEGDPYVGEGLTLNNAELNANGGTLTFSENVAFPVDEEGNMPESMTCYVVGAETKNIAAQATLSYSGEWNVLNVTFSETLEAGEYVLQIPAGKIVANDTENVFAGADVAFTVEAPAVGTPENPFELTEENNTFSTPEGEGWTSYTVKFTKYGRFALNAGSNFLVSYAGAIYKPTEENKDDLNYPYSLVWLDGQGEYVWTVSAPANTKFYLSFNGVSTGIDSINVANMKDGKFVKNGQLFIVKGGKLYNAAGAMMK